MFYEVNDMTTPRTNVWWSRSAWNVFLNRTDTITYLKKIDIVQMSEVCSIRYISNWNWQNFCWVLLST